MGVFFWGGCLVPSFRFPVPRPPTSLWKCRLRLNAWCAWDGYTFISKIVRLFARTRPSRAIERAYDVREGLLWHAPHATSGDRDTCFRLWGRDAIAGHGFPDC